jgi:hypothetical protein
MPTRLRRHRGTQFPTRERALPAGGTGYADGLGAPVFHEGGATSSLSA